MTSHLRNASFVLLAAALGISLANNYSLTSQAEETEQKLIYENQKTLQRFEDAQGRETVRQQALELTKRELIRKDKELAGKDELIALLRREAAKSPTKAAVAFQTKTAVARVAVPAVAEAPAVASREPGLPPLAQRYGGHIETEWLEADVFAGTDSAGIYSLTYYDAYAVSFRRLKPPGSGLFAAKKTFVDVSPQNPNTTVVGMRSFEAPEAKPKRLLWFSAGAAAVVGLIFGGAAIAP